MLISFMIHFSYSELKYRIIPLLKILTLLSIYYVPGILLTILNDSFHFHKIICDKYSYADETKAQKRVTDS